MAHLWTGLAMFDTERLVGNDTRRGNEFFITVHWDDESNPCYVLLLKYVNKIIVVIFVVTILATRWENNMEMYVNKHWKNKSVTISELVKWHRRRLI